MAKFYLGEVLRVNEMWKPPEKIKWHPEPGSTPSAEDVAQALLFSPLQINRINLTSRTWLPAMVPWRASEEGFVTEDVLDWYGRYAKGQPGVIVLEATGIRDVPSGPLLRIGDDRFIDGLAKLAERIRHDSCGNTKIFVQLIDFLSIRRRPKPEMFFNRFLQLNDDYRAAVSLPDGPDDEVRQALFSLGKEDWQRILSRRDFEALTMGAREQVHDMELPYIRELPQQLPELFAKAAKRAEQAGLDGVELHYAHAYTMASFLSATNNRDDGYGGVRENRVRLPVEVFKAVREAVSDNFVVGARILADECIEGGTGPDDAGYFAAEFAKAGMDFLSFSRGGKFDDAKQPKIGAAAYPYTGPSGYECMPQYLSDEQGPFGRNAKAVKNIRDKLRAGGHEMPVVCAGGVHNFAMAEGWLRDGVADIVGSARQSMADPDWLVKIQQGRSDKIRLCEYTNYCEGLDQNHKQVTCQLWDRLKLDEPGVRLSNDGKRRLVAPDDEQ